MGTAISKPFDEFNAANPVEEAYHVQPNRRRCRVAPVATAPPRIAVCTVDVGNSPGEVAGELRELLGNLVLT